MLQNTLIQRLTASAYWLPVIALCSLILHDSHFGPNEDAAGLYEFQTGQLIVGDLFGDFYASGGLVGRFAPLGNVFYSLVVISANTPTGYYIINAIELFLFAYIFFYILERAAPGWWVNRIAVALLFLITPGAVISFLELPRAEDTTLLLLAFFVVSYIRFLDTQKTAFLLTAVFFANVAIYFKEPVFAAIIVFAALHMVFTWRAAGQKQKLLDLTLIVSAMAYVLQYLVFVRPLVLRAYGVNVVDNALFAFSKNIANYALFSDPVLLLAILPLALWRGYQILFKRDPAHPLFDSMLFAAVSYPGVFIVLNMYSPYYFFPAYLLGIPPLIFFIRRKTVGGWPWRVCLVSVYVVLVGNTIPFVVHKMSYSKYVPANFNRTIEFLAKDIELRYQGERLNIFLDGMDRGSGRGMYWVFGEYLKYSGLSIRKFDLKSDIEALDPTPMTGYLGASPFDKKEDLDAVDPGRKNAFRELPFSVFQPGSLPTINKGDYLISSPYGIRNIDVSYLQALSKDYDLVFRTESRYAIPNLSLKVFLKEFMIEYTGENVVRSGAVRSGNILSWPDYYVWIKR